MAGDRVTRFCFGTTAVVAVFSLGLQFVQDWFGVGDDPAVSQPSHAVQTWRFFSYFTIQSNLLVAATSISLARHARRDGPRWRVARLDGLTGITITGLVSWFLLRPLNDFHGWRLASDTLVHIVVPVLAVLGWLLFGPRRRISLRVALLGLVWPLAWLLYTLVVGAVTGWYPYFFIDVGQVGGGVVAIYCVAILALLFVVSCAFWSGDRWLPRGSESDATGETPISPRRRPRPDRSR